MSGSNVLFHFRDLSFQLREVFNGGVKCKMIGKGKLPEMSCFDLVAQLFDNARKMPAFFQRPLSQIEPIAQPKAD